MLNIYEIVTIKMLRTNQSLIDWCLSAILWFLNMCSFHIGKLTIITVLFYVFFGNTVQFEALLWKSLLPVAIDFWSPFIYGESWLALLAFWLLLHNLSLYVHIISVYFLRLWK